MLQMRARCGRRAAKLSDVDRPFARVLLLLVRGVRGVRDHARCAPGRTRQADAAAADDDDNN